MAITGILVAGVVYGQSSVEAQKDRLVKEAQEKADEQVAATRAPAD